MRVLISCSAILYDALMILLGTIKKETDTKKNNKIEKKQRHEPRCI